MDPQRQSSLAGLDIEVAFTPFDVDQLGNDWTP